MLPKLSKKDSLENTSTSTVPSEDENPERGNWSGKLDFLMSCLSYAVGLGNLWRFPYLCYRNGGGAFLIPYVIMLIFAGMPMFFMELAFGQYASEGVISIWKICPLMQGIGWGMFIVSCFIAVYYNMLIAWTIFYLGASINVQVPWTDCDNHWNSPECGMLDVAALKNCTLLHEGVWFNHTCYLAENTEPELYNEILNITADMNMEDHLRSRTSPSDEYFHNFVLDISEGVHNLGGVRWQMALSLFGAWVLVCLCLIKGIKSQGKAVYFTATFPYLVLCVLLVRGLTLPGAIDGILYYLTPQWSRLLTAKVWGDAAVQIFFSLSPCWGGLITLASYNKFHNNCLRDAIVVSIANCATSFFAGFVIFGIIGFMAHEMGVTVDNVAKQGAGLAFIVYPEVVSRLPASPLWAILFFAMLITLGLGTQFSVVTTIHTTLLDVFPHTLRVGRRPMLVMVLVCFVGFLLGLICCTQGGMYVLQLIDNYAATYSLLIIGLCECCTIAYIYGVDRFFKNIEDMLGRKPPMWWKVMWMGVTPVLLAGIMVFTWIDYTPSKYDDYHYPAWADAVGWVLTMTSVLAIPTVAIYKIVSTDHDGSILEKIRFLAKPSREWGPASERNRIPSNYEAHIPLHTPDTDTLEVQANGHIPSAKDPLNTVDSIA